VKEFYLYFLWVSGQLSIVEGMNEMLDYFAIASMDMFV
jgi:hypothetical protein